ncbi:MAG: DNA-deoxyinosine glycosylase [Elusimicrobiota bacterium]
MIHSFKPIVGKNPRVLILGTMPGAMSLKKRQYYGHPQNSFWKIIFKLFGITQNDSYRVKKALLKKQRIALWDVLRECSRERSSSDSDIRNERPNRIGDFLKKHKSVKFVAFNGSAPERFIKKQYNAGNFPQKLIKLPSTSPANTITASRKLEQWKKILACLKKTA